MKPIYVTRPSMPNIEEFIREITPVFDNSILTNMGPVHEKLRHQLIDYMGVPELSLFVNGHMALELAIQALGFKQRSAKYGDGEVITTPFTFVSTVHAIARNNLKPIFCDIKRDDYCIDPDKIEALITDRTVGIIPVHVYGNICDVDKIDSIAKKHDLKVIYDGAHAFGEKYRGVGIGNFGDATMFSFHATKVFHTIEGGAISFKDERYRKILRDLKNFGIQNEEEVTMVGSNAKLDEFRAAMGICNLRRIDECIQARKKVYERYVERLNGVKGLTICLGQPGVNRNYAYFPVLFDEAVFGRGRNDIYTELKSQGVFARKYFYPAVNDMQCYRQYSDQRTPIAHDVSMKILTLPIYEGLPMDVVDTICDIVLQE